MMSPTTTTSTTMRCKVPTEEGGLALQVLAKLLRLEVDFKDGGGGDSSATTAVEMDVVTPQFLTKPMTTTTYRGHTDVARGLCLQVPLCGLWGGDAAATTDAMMTDTAAVTVEAWMDLAVQVLLPVIVESPDSPDADTAKNQVSDFLARLETHLTSSPEQQTCLVGGTPTAADVCLAVWLAQACHKVQPKDEIPSATYQWANTILQHDVVKATKVPALVVTKKQGGGEEEGAPALLSEEDNVIVQKLHEWNLPHTVYSHVLCNTAEELVQNVPIPEKDSHTKNLFLKDKKHGLFLITVKPSTDVNTKHLGQMLNLQGKVNLRLADEKTLMDCLGVRPGCVGPLSIVNDSDKQVTLVLDQALLLVENIHSHPLTNDASVIMTPATMQEYLKKAEHEPVVLDFTPDPAAVAAQGKPPASRPKESKQPKGTKPDVAPPKEKAKDKKTSKKGETLLALQWKKEENFAMWYSDVIVLSEMISYYDISGCYILRPWSYKMWELIQEWFNGQIRALDVENAYFPLFVSQDRLEKEKDHVEGFAPEVAWVTRSGDGVLAKPIAVRPTSETIMYPAFSDWIKSHRDLPLKLNQWSNVVRWEFKDPTPFLRSREFLWQEGHTAHVSLEDADVMVQQALDLYRRVYEELLAVPVIKGYKTEKEKFAGGYQTTTVEAYIPMSGRAIQGATSHNLGQNFGKMFDITFQDEKGESQVAWQTSWGLTTRSLGVMIMVHGDDTGLVLPPRVAPLQVVIVPIVSKKLSIEEATPYCESILNELKAIGIRAKYDDRTMYNPGWKYNHWEQKGVPVRIEVGPRDIEQKMARVVIRHDGEKVDLPIDNLAQSIQNKLEEAQTAMFEGAKKIRDQHVVQVTEWKDFVPNLELNNLVLTPWCGGEHSDWEEWVKEKSREESLQNRGEGEEDARTATSVAAKTLCIPFEQPDLPKGTKCIASGLEAKCWVLWGRSY